MFRPMMVACLAVFLPTMASAQSGSSACPTNWQQKAAGSYNGHVGGTWDGADKPHEITTTFAVGANGKLAGVYLDHEVARENPGTLELMIAEPCRATFHWHDLYGDGRAVFNFSIAAGRFRGVYGGPGEKQIDPETSWDGRLDQPRSN